MIGPSARKCILIGLLSRLLVSIASSNEVALFDKELHFGATEGNSTLFLNFGERRAATRRESDASLVNAEKTFKNKANTLSRLFKIHIDRLKNQTDQVTASLQNLISHQIGTRCHYF